MGADNPPPPPPPDPPIIVDLRRVQEIEPVHREPENQQREAAPVIDEGGGAAPDEVSSPPAARLASESSNAGQVIVDGGGGAPPDMVDSRSLADTSAPGAQEGAAKPESTSEFDGAMVQRHLDAFAASGHKILSAGYDDDDPRLPEWEQQVSAWPETDPRSKLAKEYATTALHDAGPTVLRTVQESKVYAAVDENGQVVGIASSTLYRGEGDHNAILGHLGSRDTGEGVGTALMVERANDAADRGHGLTGVGDLEASGWHERLGFSHPYPEVPQTIQMNAEDTRRLADFDQTRAEQRRAPTGGDGEGGGAPPAPGLGTSEAVGGGEPVPGADAASGLPGGNGDSDLVRATQSAADAIDAEFAAESDMRRSEDAVRAEARGEVTLAERDIASSTKEIKDIEGGADEKSEYDWMDSAKLDELRQFRDEAYQRLDENLATEYDPNLALTGEEKATAEEARNRAQQAQRDIAEAEKRVRRYT